MKQYYLSIVVPVLNGDRHIGNLLNSLVDLNYPNDKYEILIIDNGSKDGTVEIIKNFQKVHQQIKLFFEKRKSSYAARNKGIRNAIGDIMVFTDADCVVDKDWLVNIESYFSDEKVGGLAGEILSQEGNSLVEIYLRTGIISQKRSFNSKFMPYAQTANAAYRKELFYRIGFFDEIISGGDADFSWRMQLETDYKLLYGQDAIVIHKHRTNLKDLFKQRFKHGYGYILIRDKYKNYPDQTKKIPNLDNSGFGFLHYRWMIQKLRIGWLLLPDIVNALGLYLGKIYARFLLWIRNIKNRNRINTKRGQNYE